MDIGTTTLSDVPMTDTVDFIEHLSSSIWRRVEVHLTPILTQSSISLNPRSSPPSTIEMIALWSAFDNTLSHSNYDSLTTVMVDCNELEVDTLPPEYDCTNDLFPKLLPRLMESGRLQVECIPRSSYETSMCPYHRYSSHSSVLYGAQLLTDLAEARGDKKPSGRRMILRRRRESRRRWRLSARMNLFGLRTWSKKNVSNLKDTLG